MKRLTLNVFELNGVILDLTEARRRLRSSTSVFVYARRFRSSRWILTLPFPIS